MPRRSSFRNNTKVELLFVAITKNTYLNKIEAPDVKEEKQKIYGSPYLWVPIASVGIVALVANILFIKVAEININAINLMTELLAFIIIAQIFFSFFRKRQLERTNRQKFENELKEQGVVDKARNTFMKDTAKNLKAELATLIATTTTIKDKKYLKDAELGMTELEALIEKFEFLSQLEAGKLSLAVSSIGLSGLAGSLIKANQEKLLTKNITIRLPKDDLQIDTDKEKLAFILGNVLDNAIKFNKDKGEVNLSWSQEHNLTKIEVEDTGVGISKEGQELLFKPFSRGTSTLQFDYEGMGTNLYIAKLVANYLDGDISVESKLGKETKTTIIMGNTPNVSQTNQKPDNTTEPITNPGYKQKKAPAMMNSLGKQK